MENEKNLWKKFLDTGHINDYLNYKIYLRRINNNETNHQKNRNRPTSNTI